MKTIQYNRNEDKNEHAILVHKPVKIFPRRCMAGKTRAKGKKKCNLLKVSFQIEKIIKNR